MKLLSLLLVLLVVLGTSAEARGTGEVISLSSAAITAAVPAASPQYGYPIGLPDRTPGDGFFIRHGYAVENTWYLPGYWHTGEDWYARAGETAGALVYAIAAGTVVYAGANYPGRVVIVEHTGALFSMYGHLDPALAVKVGQRVHRGTRLGTVLRRGDKTPSHLHFEVRTFLTTRAVNGAAPRYQFRCGRHCPPGPGYWPIKAPEQPGTLGWRNPTHVIAQRALPAGSTGSLGDVAVAMHPATDSARVWSAPPGTRARQILLTVKLQPGTRFRLLEVQAGPENGGATSAQAYHLWYRVVLSTGQSGWVQAAVPSRFETGSDGRASTVVFNVYPVAEAAR